LKRASEEFFGRTGPDSAETSIKRVVVVRKVSVVRSFSVQNEP